jgi:hypothetical protein
MMESIVANINIRVKPASHVSSMSGKKESRKLICLPRPETLGSTTATVVGFMGFQAWIVPSVAK